MQPFRPRRVLAYARVSTGGQEDHRGGTSLEHQQEQFAFFCRSQDYPKPIVYVEVEGAGQEKLEKRVEMHRLMRDARDGDLVICTRQDRWSRYTLFYLQSTEQLLAKGARFFSITERFDPATPEGKFAATQMASVAELEHARIKDRTLGARRRLRAMGKFVEGFAPLGYAADRETRALVIDETKAEIIRRMFAMCARGMSTRQIADKLAEDYPDVPGLDPSNVSRRLRSRTYLGEMMPKAKEKKGRIVKDRAAWRAAFPPLVEPSLWAKVQAALDKRRGLGRPGTTEARTASFLLRGLVRCGTCGYVMVSHSPTPGASTTHGGWYMCRPRDKARERRCKFGPLVRHVELDALVDAAMLARLGELVATLSKSAGVYRAPAAPDFEGRKATLLRRRKKIADAVSREVMSDEDARETLADINHAIGMVEQEREEYEQREVQKTPAERRRELSSLKALRAAWNKLEVAEKRRIISLHAEKLLVYSTGAAKWKRSGTWRFEAVWKPI